MFIVSLTDAEAFDAASIIRGYARTIREEIKKIRADADGRIYPPTPPHVFAALEQSAEQRERLADKLDGTTDA